MANHIRTAIDPQYLQLCRVMRTHAIDAESLLWQLLRNRQLGGLKFRRQHSVRSFIFDFYCPVAKLGIELDGGHADPCHAESDAQRGQLLAQEGIRVLRFWNHEGLAETVAVMEVVWETVQAGHLD